MSGKTFEQCVKSLESGEIKTLEQLFDLWEEAHKREDENSFKETKPKALPDDVKDRFIPDGSLSSNAIEKHSILFVCRESNVSAGTDGRFWMKDVVECKMKGRVLENADATAKRSATKYFNCMEALARELNQGGMLETCAYMNINKRGGFASADFRSLGKYAKKYQVFIKKEIEILQPDVIVVLGRFFDNKELCELFQSLPYEIRQYKRHPSVWKKWGEQVIPEKLFNKQIN